MPAALDRCVQKVMKTGKSKSSAFAICTTQLKTKDSNDQLFFETHVPIVESLTDQDEFMIEGIAINETTTSNGHKFISEELKKAAPSLINIPLLKDHDNSVDAIVGRVRNASFDEKNNNIPFQAKISDQKMQELIRNGDLNTVSVGASVNPKDIEELEDGTIIPRNITFKELSLVAVPADPGATFGVSLMESYNQWKESNSTNVENKTERGLKNMTEDKPEEKTEEEEDKPEVKESEESEEPKEPEEKEEVEPKVDELAKENELLRENLDLRRKRDEALAKEAKEVKTEKPKAKKVKETEELEVETEGYEISVNGNSASVIRERYDSATNVKPMTPCVK